MQPSPDPFVPHAAAADPGVGEVNATDLGTAGIAVIGGGVVGAAIAYGLTRQGEDVCMLDEADIAHRASRANFALVWVQGKGWLPAQDRAEPDYAILTRSSAAAWQDFAAELEAQSHVAVHFAGPGGFNLALSDDALEQRRIMLQRLDATPGVGSSGFEVLGRNALMKILPDIGPDVVGGIFCPLDGHVNSPKLLHALHVASQRLGLRFLAGAAVREIVPVTRGFRLATAAGTLTARRIVISAGLGSERLAAMVGLHAPVRPIKGTIMVTEKLAPFLHHPITNLRQTNEGGVMLGGSTEDVGYDDSVGIGISGALAARAVQMFPRLASASIVRVWSGLRVMSPDGLPVYEESARHPGAFVCLCHSGVTLAAAHALMLAPMLSAGRIGAPFASFKTARFDVPAPV
ncbi:glycine/D-amino acid oxidase-like deaminating enzyme [Humitalea rosea]|uniref:Glycine/D-amino acid oxidase-like deaminating enzyme n=1 Tax=Humitalea rosea TaxID=990373 RepID=A0A2W7HU91_9PROT|nr:glycine/D-amino acid oxidase-like deaminating enzyme [Humitalea rosea]